MSGTVRTSVATLRGVVEALGWHDRERLDPETVGLFGTCLALEPRFDVILRLEYYGPVDRLQQGPPRHMLPALTWVVEDGDRTYAGTMDAGRDGWLALRKFLKRALVDLKAKARGELAVLPVGSDPAPYA